MTHTQQYVSRSRSALLTAAVGLLLSAVCCFLLATSSIGALGVIVALFGAAGTAYAICFWLYPVAWKVELSGHSLRWQSPHLPHCARELPLSEIAAAWVSTGETETAELRLTSGELVTLPASCVPHPGKLISALHAADPKIQGQQR